SGKNVVIEDDPQFNPKIDATTIGNFNDREKYGLFIHPESVRSEAAIAHQGLPTVGAEEWKLRNAIGRICLEANEDEDFILNPELATEDFKDAPAPDNITLTRGEYLPAYLDAMLPPHGMDWYVALSLEQSDSDDDDSDMVVQPRIVVYRIGKGVSKTVHWQDVAEELDLKKQNLRTASISQDIGTIANEIVCHGSRKEYEITIELYRAWPEADDALGPDDLRKDIENSPESQYETKENVWRKFVGNEAADYSELRKNVRPIPKAPPNLKDALAGLDITPARRMRMGKMLKTNDSGMRLQPRLSYRWADGPTNAGLWRTIPPEWPGGGYQILTNEIGVLFTGDAPPEDLMDMGDDARLRLTGTLTDNTRLEAIATPQFGSPNSRTVTLFLDVSDRFHFRKGLLTGGALDWDGHNAQGVQQNFTSQAVGVEAAFGIATDEQDDTKAIEEYAEKNLTNENAATVEASLVLHGIHTSYDIGDIIKKIEGREISLNRKFDPDPESTFVQITGIDYDFENQQTRLILAPTEVPIQ
ncbi:MAG: hypothetical protein V3T49_02375, partial [Dehalococcoidia bacterium]